MKDIIIKENEELKLPVLWLGEETELAYNIQLAGIGANLKLFILLLGRDMNKLNLKVNVFHLKPNTQSKVIVKGALNDSAFVDFDGLVKIEKGAKGTNAWLAAHFLLLSNMARGRAVPSLEILENDIKAGHATTVGRVNNLELFYLMSRGISEKDSKSLIVHGFLNSMIEQLPNELADKATKEIAYV